MNENANDRHDVKPDYRHTYPVFGLVAGIVVVAAIVRAWLVPDTFGRLGYFRAAALDDEIARKAHHSPQDACAECHDDIVALHRKDVHATVDCQTCHGAGAAHVADEDVDMSKADRQEDCLVCHRLLDARPGTFPQIDRDKHYKFVGVKDPALPCTRCHSGHEPLYLDREIAKARLHPLIHDCGDCHIGRTDESLDRPQGHPQIFQCDYCHEDIVRSFAKNSHKDIRCTTCHLFIKENSFSGRIIRDSDPRFCLLCHRKADFKAEDGPPAIAWPSHITDVSDEKADPKRSCTSCHEDSIHILYPKEGRHGL